MTAYDGSSADVTETTAETGARVPAPPADGLPKRFGRNVFMNYAASGANAVYAIIITPLIVRGLGKAAFGVWALANSVTSYLELFELGFGAATTKLVAEDAGRRPDRVVRTINTSLVVLSGLGVVALVTTGILAANATTWFDIPDDLATETVVAIVALGLALSISVPGDTLGGALAGHQRFDLLSGSNIMLITLNTVGSIVVIAAGGGIVQLALMTATFSISMHVVRYVFLKGVLPELHVSPRYVDWSRVRPLTSLSWWFLISQLSGVVILRIDLVVVAATLSIEDVAVYAVAAKLAQFCMRAFRDLSSVFLPHATSLYHGGESERIPEIQVDGTRVSVLMTMPILLVLMMFGDSALEAWVGNGFTDAIPVLTLLTLAAGLRSAIEPTFALLNATGRVKTVALTVMCEAILNISLSLILVTHLDLVGPALGTLIASLVVTLPVFLTSFRWLGASRADFVRRSLLPHLPPALVTAALLLAFDLLLPAGRFWIFLVAPAAFLTYMVTYWKISATPAERERVRSAIERFRRGRSSRGADA